MAWIDTLSERDQKELKLARLYATKEFGHGTTGHNALLLIAQLADALDTAEADAALARIAAMDDRLPLAQILTGARNAGAAAWIVRGAQHAGLIYTNERDAGEDVLVGPDTSLWPLLSLTPPHEIIVLIRIPESDGGEAGIEWHGPEAES